MRAKGFSAIELLGTLVILGSILLITNHFIAEINQKKQFNALSDQITYFNNMAIKYTIDNYRVLEESARISDFVVPYSIMYSYTSIGNNIIPATKIKPCLYLSYGVNDTLNAYLYFGKAINTNLSYSYLLSSQVAQDIGGNAGVLVSNQNGFTIKGNLFNNTSISSSQATTIANNCGFIGENLLSNSVVIAINQDKRLFASLKTNVDVQSDEQNSDPSLKRSGSGDAVTMQTNLYLDNVIKESTSTKSYYCDNPSKLPIQDARVMCMQYGSHHIPLYSMNDGTSSWYSNVLNSSNTCLASADARFTETVSGEDVGYIVCGTSTFSAIESDNPIPSEHIYQALDFGKSPIGYNQRIQIKSDAPIGAPTNTSQLDINNAGITASYIAPISHQITPGSDCGAKDLGMMAQELNPIGGGGQLQCTYNPTYCVGNGYCYLPTKPSGIMLTFNQLTQDGHCPAGTVVDQNQPSDGINKQAYCPPLSGLAFQGIEGILAGAYQSVTGFTFYSDYATYCVYRDSSGNLKNNPVSALAKLFCTANVTNYTVDNYRP